MPYQPFAPMNPAARRHLQMLQSALRGVQVSDVEQSALLWLAGEQPDHCRAIARLFARARGARTVLSRQGVDDEPVDCSGGSVADVLDAHGLRS